MQTSHHAITAHAHKIYAQTTLHHHQHHHNTSHHVFDASSEPAFHEKSWAGCYFTSTHPVACVLHWLQRHHQQQHEHIHHIKFGCLNTLFRILIANTLFLCAAPQPLMAHSLNAKRQPRTIGQMGERVWNKSSVELSVEW